MKPPFYRVYVLHPGSCPGTGRYIPSVELAMLYGLRHGECKVSTEITAHLFRGPGFIHLYPKRNYKPFRRALYKDRRAQARKAFRQKQNHREVTR